MNLILQDLTFPCPLTQALRRISSLRRNQSQRVSKLLASSQNNFLSSQFNEHRPSWSFKQRKLNQAITITLRLTEHANIFLNTYPVVVFSDLSLQPLLLCTRCQQCFTTATTPSGSAILNISNCHVCCIVTWHLLATNSKLAENFEPSSEYSLWCWQQRKIVSEYSQLACEWFLP